MAEFGSVFYEQMPLTKFDGTSWQPTQWQGSNALTLHPGAHVLHYASTCFEGMKAFRQRNGKLAVFRLDDHISRMQNSARGVFLPEPDTEQMRDMILSLVARADSVIPDMPGALYLRPTLLGTNPAIGRANTPSDTALFYVLGSPVAEYFDPSKKMVLAVETTDLRCAPHMGNLKTGGNYASALPLTLNAQETLGASQLLFCPNGDVQESGAANFILVDGDTLITKSLSSQFLPGVTRRSLLQLAKDKGMSVVEKDFTVSELKAHLENGAEAMLTGTAAILVPVSAIIIDGKRHEIVKNDIAMQLRQDLLSIQGGEAEDKHGWLTMVD